MKTVLAVDDDNVNLATTREVLSGTYKVILVKKGQQALSYLENGECDVILLDINMPEMDGFEVMRRIRQMDKCKDIPVIFLTGDTDSETEARCFKEGAIDFIAKPFVPAVMLHRIGRILELDELRRGLANKLEQKIREVSDIKSRTGRDALTGLWNREYTEDAVNSMLQSGTGGAVMMIDMDNFKLINDNYGHIAGDKTLKMFADTLREYSVEGDVLCRIGGDEFVVFVKGTPSNSELSRRAADIISDICRKIGECGFETDTSVSIGIAKTPDDGTDFASLYNSADKALYYVKQNGKNSYHFFSDRVAAESGRSGHIIDIKYLQEIMNRSDGGNGSYQLEFDSFHHVYNFIRRFVERGHKDVQILLFTINGADGGEPEEEDLEQAVALLEQAIFTCLRRSDISTRYSGRQIIVILMDVTTENCSMVCERITENFGKLYPEGKVTLECGIASLK